MDLKHQTELRLPLLPMTRFGYTLINSPCDQIVSFIEKERTPIYTFQFAWHFAHATPLLVRSREIRTNEVQGIT
jgi:hypothetical protein